MATNDRRVGNLLIQMRAELGGLKTDIKELDNEFKKGFSNIQQSAASAFKTVGIAIAGAFSVSAIINFGRSIVDLAGRIQDLSDQTGISAQLLSGMKSTLEQSGTSMEAFAKGIFNAQKSLGEIDSESDKAAVAIKFLKLNLDELRNATPEKMLQLVTEALAKIENPTQRATLAAALLKKGAQELTPPLLAMVGRLEELRARGMSDADIKALDEYGDNWVKLSNSIQIAASGPLGSVARLINDAAKSMEYFNLQWLRFQLNNDPANVGARAGALGELGG
jgi:hypothetical protein